MTAIGNALIFKAGRQAFDTIRRDGFSLDRIGTIIGASGGAKWLVLSQLDRVLIQRVLPQLSGPLFLLGSSIGAWRFACYAQASPLAAIDRFETAYLEQRYSEQPDIDEITEKSRDILNVVLGRSGVRDILAHPILRTNIMTVRARHLAATETRPVLAGSLLLAMLANAASRRALGAFFSRALFYDARDVPPFFAMSGFPIHRVPLSAANLADVVIASGSIPMVLSGVRNIDGAPSGTYRDGGVIDYHLDMAPASADKVALFPHFFDWLKPGWFDRRLPWRHVNAEHFSRTVLICPSAGFIANLPGGKVPDRTDFVKLTSEQRIDRWTRVVERCAQLADELDDVLSSGALPARLERL